MAGQAAGGVEYLERGLGLFVLRGQQFKASNVGARVVNELNGRGLKREAQQISDYLKQMMPDESAASVEAAPVKRPVLPTHCPGCGAPVATG